MLNLVNKQAQSDAESYIFYLPLSRIEDNPYQTRITTDADHVLGIAQSILDLANELPASKGLQQVPLARLAVWGDNKLVERQVYADLPWLRSEANNSEIVAQLAFGHTRLRAFQVLAWGPQQVFPGQEFTPERWPHSPQPGYTKMPLLLCYADDLAMWKHAVTENQQRKGITAIEEARALQMAEERFKLTSSEAGAVFGWSRSTAANKKRLLALPAEVQQMILNGEMSERHGRSLLEIKDEPQRLIAVATENKGKTVAEIEWAVRHEKRKIEEDANRLKQEAAASAAGYRVAERQGEAAPFGQWNVANSELLKRKHCGQGCACFAALYAQNNYGGEKLNIADAPNMVACCTDPDAVRKKAAELNASHQQTAASKSAQKKERAQATNAQLEEQWRTTTEQIIHDAGGRMLWMRPEFWRIVVDRCFDWRSSSLKSAGAWQDMDGFVNALLAQLLKSTEKYGSAGIEEYQGEKVKELLDALGEIVKR